MSIIQSFKDLDAWKEGHRLVLSVYAITRKFPREEVFALTDQMRRSAVSITSNLAEGFGRQSPKDKQHFYQIALGSLMELQNQTYIARDLMYINSVEFDTIEKQAVKVEMIYKGLIRKTKTLNTG